MQWILHSGIFHMVVEVCLVEKKVSVINFISMVGCSVCMDTISCVSV